MFYHTIAATGAANATTLSRPTFARTLKMELFDSEHSIDLVPAISRLWFACELRHMALYAYKCIWIDW